MLKKPLFSWLAVILLAVLGFAPLARAQSDSDADADDSSAAAPTRKGADEAADDDAPKPVPVPRAPKPAPPAVPVAKPVTPETPKAKPILLPRVGDAEVLAAWGKWRKAYEALDVQAEDASQKELLTLKGDLAAEDFESLSAGLLRAAEARLDAHDGAGALSLARTAAELSPDLPLAHLRLAEMLFRQDLTGFGAWFAELRLTAHAIYMDPRYGRALISDVGTAFALAWAATTLVALAVMLLLRGRYLLHDVHHLFPRATAPWQSTVAFALVLLLPIVFRLGLVPALLLVFAALTLYLSTLERALALVMLAVIIALPFFAGALAAQTSFSGTPAEDVLMLERGGLEAKPAADRVRTRVADDKASFPELFALGRYETRRGKLEEAILHFKLAAAQRTNDPRLLTNLANAMLMRGDVEGAAELYTSATQTDPSLAMAFFNLAKLYSRRAVSMGDDTVGMELDRAQNALATASRIDESLYGRQDPPPENLLGNRLLLSPPLKLEELAPLTDPDGRSSHVVAQLSGKLLGTASFELGAVLSLIALGLLGAVGFLKGQQGLARACEKCGRPVCRRCDPELILGSKLCNQCVHAFARRGAVAPTEKVRKQIEIHQYQQRQARTAYALGVVCSGLGHLFSGLPFRGVAYAFFFIFALSCAYLRAGVLRTPFGPIGGALWLAPLFLVGLLLYVTSLRGLHRRQTE